MLFAPEGSNEFSTLAPYTAEMKTIGGRAAAYVCEGFACQAPIVDPEDLFNVLNERAR